MVTTYRLKAERFFFLIPLIVSFHDDHASIFYEVQEGFFIQQFLNPAINDKIEMGFMSPFHKLNFTVILVLQIQIFIALFLLFIQIKSRRLNCRDVCGWTDVEWARVKLWVGGGFGIGNFKKSC